MQRASTPKLFKHGMKWTLQYILTFLVELAGLILIFSGLIVEVSQKADYGYMLITAGSGLIALGSFIWAKVLRKPAEA